MTLEEMTEQCKAPSQTVMEASRRRWDSIAKPLRGLGLLEEAVVCIAGATGEESAPAEPRAVVVFCADNGVVDQGVTQAGREVTAIVAGNMTRGETCVCQMARLAGARVVPVDMGMATRPRLPGLWERRIASGTADMTLGPAMSREEALAGMTAGFELARELRSQGYRLLATGEMGIGNTTTSSAVAAVLLGKEPREVTGRGAGLSSAGLERKVGAIEKALRVNRPDPGDPVDILAKVGGFDLAGMAGLCLGGAAFGLPVVLDGFISTVAALVAARLCPVCRQGMIASHCSGEPAAELVLRELGKKPMITAGLCLGEGTGAVAAMPLLDMALAVYRGMSTFEEIRVEQYTPQG